jgi:hypothetical protein
MVKQLVGQDIYLSAALSLEEEMKREPGKGLLTSALEFIRMLHRPVHHSG